MSDKKCIKYTARKTKELAIHTVDNICADIMSKETDIKVLQRLCGAMCYSSLFLISDYDLQDEHNYTFENVCYFIPGILKIPMHDLLERLSDICIGSSSMIETLDSILSEAMYPELVDLLGLSTKNTYCSLLLYYTQLTNRYDLKEKVKSMWHDQNIHIHELWKFFDFNIKHKGVYPYNTEE